MLTVALVGNLVLLVDSHDRFMSKIDCETVDDPDRARERRQSLLVGRLQYFTWTCTIHV